MKFNVIPTLHFKKEAKRLLKKYNSLKSELFELERVLSIAPKQGTDLGHGVYKIRLSIKSKGKGKSGGARVITYFLNQKSEIYLLTIYDKSELSSVDMRSLKLLITEIQSR